MMSKRVKSPPTLDESDKVSTTFDIVTYYLVEVNRFCSTLKQGIFSFAVV